MNDTEKTVKALRCGSMIGGRCFAECQFRENGYCELTPDMLRINAADLIERQQSEISSLYKRAKINNKLHSGLTKDYYDIKKQRDALTEENARLEKDNLKLQTEVEAAYKHGGKYMAIAEKRYEMFEKESARREKAEAERDAAVEDISECAYDSDKYCHYCVYDENGNPSNKTLNEHCFNCGYSNPSEENYDEEQETWRTNWKWRGEKC